MKFPIGFFFAAMCFSSVFGQILYEAYLTLKENQNYCVQQTGVSLEFLKKVLRERKIDEDERQEEFAICMLKKAHIMNDNGSIINKNKLSLYLLSDNALAHEAARDCVDISVANVRESARKVMTCLLQVEDLMVLDPMPSSP